MIIRPLKPEDIPQINLQPAQANARLLQENPEYCASLCNGKAYAAVVGGQIVAAGGLVEMWEGRAHAWALVGVEAGRHWVAIHRATLRAFDAHPFRRVETAVASSFRPGHRWAEMLGFVREGCMRAYAPGGDDCDLYARVVCTH